MTAKNLLADETSPYLLQHAANPVHWHPWGNAALAEANERGKPILLSVGYAACHWCHVMAHESFEDPDTAALMNELFVCIKVDREERPDVDQLYMTALHALGEQGGWPLTMFLDSAGAPFWGGTYFPPEPRYGRASFRQVLQGIATAFASDADAIRRNALALTRSLARQAEPTPGALPDDTDLAQLASAFLRLTDAEYGGLRGAPKFPNPPVFRLLWQFGRRLGKPAMCEAVHLLLTRMTHGGIYDQLGGGYARYSTDSVWLVPHFEKMLYDNAQILELLACAYASDRRPLYQAAADQTVRWLLRDMIAEPRNGDAAFAASEDADSEGEEGRFYVWEEAQIDDLLGLSAAAFKQAYDVTAGGNWDGQCILRWVSAQGDPASFEGDRSILFAARAQRVRPGRDDKVLADWNGLTIAALARAAGVFDRSDWLLAAISAYRFVCTHMRQASGGIAHSWRLGRVTAHGVLDDQAAMARAALALFEATGERQFLADAESLVSASILNFGAPDGAFYLTAADASDLPLGPACRQRTAADNATPAGSGVMAEVFARLFHLTGQDRYRVDCERLIAAFAGGSNGLQAAPSMASAADLLAHGGCIVVSGDPNTPATKTLLRVARAGADLTLCVLSAPAGLADTHPAYNAASSARPSAHLCRNQTCSLPVEEPSQLLALMG